jgi:hypothetical protein
LTIWFSSLLVTAIYTSQDSERLHFFYRDHLNGFVNRADLFVRHSRDVRVQSEDICTFSIASGQVRTVVLFFALQFEIRFLDSGMREIRRVITVRIPSSPLSRIYQSAAFPAPVRHAAAALALIICRVRTAPDRDRRQLAERLASTFPMQHSFWPRTVLTFRTAPVWDDTIAPINRCGYFISLHMPDIIVRLLSFVALDLVDNKFVAALSQPEKPPDARVTLEGVWCSGSDSAPLDFLRDFMPFNENASIPTLSDTEAMLSAWRVRWLSATV